MPPQTTIFFDMRVHRTEKAKPVEIYYSIEEEQKIYWMRYIIYARCLE